MAVISDGLHRIPHFERRATPANDRPLTSTSNGGGDVSELSEVVSVGGFVGGLTLFWCHVNDLRVKGPPSVPLPHAHSHTLHLKQSGLVLKASGRVAKNERIPEGVLKFVPVC